MSRPEVRGWVAAALVASVVACKGSESSSSTPSQPTVDPGTKGMNVLGAGTDVFGEYAVEANVKGRLLDVEALNRDGKLVYSPNIEESKYVEAAGSVISEYATSLSASVGLTGNYKFFSAEMRAAFSQDTYRREDYSYASIIERHWKHSLKVEPGLWTSGAHLRGYLTPLAKAAIDNTDSTRTWTGADVIAAYGTHVMNGIYVGGRLDYHLAIQILNQAYRASLMTYAKASYDAAFASAGLEVVIDAGVKAAMDAYNRVGPVINAKGGASQYAHPENDSDYAQWKTSLDTNPVFCGIISGSLLGVWELAGTPERRAELLAAYEAYATEQGAAFIPLLEKITDLRVLNGGPGGTSVTPPTGYKLLTALSGNTANGYVNLDIWNDTGRANNVYIAYLAEVTAAPVGISEVHVASTEAAVNDLFFGGVAHDEIYGAGQPGCLANAAAGLDLNGGTCKSASIWDWYSGWCAVYMWSASCSGAGTPLFLHHVTQTGADESIRCLVVGDEIAVNANQPIDTRRAHIYWGPSDVNHDGKVDGLDADWVLAHVSWLTYRDASTLVNLNHGTQSYHRYNWYDCGLGEGYDDAWIHAQNALEDAQYIGVCLP